MKTIHLTNLTLKPKEGADLQLVEGYERFLVFYPAVDMPSVGYLNIQFLDAELQDHSLRCRNDDEAFKHELWIIQFNHPLPPIFRIEPWQILIEGKVSK